MVFESIEDLCSYLNNVEIPKMLKDKVAPVIKNIEQDVTQEVVYDVYNPAVYERRYENGGLKDKDNMIERVTSDGNSILLEIKNVTTVSEDSYDHSQGTYLDEIIEYGLPAYNTEYNQPRPFTQKTQERINESGEIEKIIQQSLDRL